MEIKTVRDGLVAVLKADPDIISKIGAAQVDYGLPRKINQAMLVKGSAIRVVSRGRGEEEMADSGGGETFVWAPYRFHVVTVFQLTDTEDEKDAEDYESDYDRIMRKAISNGYTLNGIATDVEFGDTVLRQHPEKDTIYFVLLEVTALVYESATER